MKKIILITILIITSSINLTYAYNENTLNGCGITENKFNDQNLNKIFSEVKGDLAEPLFNFKQINDDIMKIEVILKESKVTSFYLDGTETKSRATLRYDHKGIQFISGYHYCHFSEGTEEAQFLIHKDLDLILKKAAQEMKKMRKE